MRAALRRATATVWVAGALAVPSIARAHGGSHPTPWPQPPGTPSTPPSPGKPSGTKPGGSGGGTWERWWELNKWRFFARTGAGVEFTGPDAPPTAEVARLTRRTGVDWLLAQSSHEYFDVRSAAALALGKSGDGRARARLTAMLDDPNREVQESAALGLGLLRDDGALPALVDGVLLDRARPARLRAAAAIAVGFIGSAAATPTLARAARGMAEPEIRHACLAGLGLLRDAAAVPSLLEVLLDGAADEADRAHAATALGKGGLRRARVGMGDAAREVDVAACLARVLQAERGERLLARSAVQALGALGATDRLEAVVAALEGHRDDPTRHLAAIAAAQLARGAESPAKDTVRARLAAQLTGRAHDARGFAALALGVLGDPAAGFALRERFQSESDPSLRAACAIGLGLLHDAAAVPALQGVLLASNDTKLRGYCCEALGLIGHPGALADLRRVLTTASTPELKAAAAMALALMGHQAAVTPLIESLAGASNYVRMSTIVALGYLVDRAEQPVFKELARDFNWYLPGELIALVLRLL